VGRREEWAGASGRSAGVVGRRERQVGRSGGPA